MRQSTGRPLKLTQRTSNSDILKVALKRPNKKYPVIVWYIRYQNMQKRTSITIYALCTVHYAVSLTDNLPVWFSIILVNKSNKYFKYLSESPDKNSLSPDTCAWPRLFLAGDSDKYLKYFLILLTRLIFSNIFSISQFALQMSSFLHIYLTWSVIGIAYLVRLCHAVILVVCGQKSCCLTYGCKMGNTKICPFSWILI